MRALELPPRLHLIAGWVPKGTRLADVGTDHAYLPNWLRLHGKIREAIASDLALLCPVGTGQETPGVFMGRTGSSTACAAACRGSGPVRWTRS